MPAKRTIHSFTEEQIKVEGFKAYSSSLLDFAESSGRDNQLPDGYMAGLLAALSKHVRYMERHKFDADSHELPVLSPLAKWFARRMLERYRESLHEGYPCILSALNLCLTHELKIPKWLATAYQEAFVTAQGKLSRSWDDVFGTPIPKGIHASRLNGRRYLRYAVFNFVREEHERGAAIDEAIFERAGEIFGIKKTLASDVYYEAKKLIE